METVVVVGPGGAGKSPLVDLFRAGVVPLDPHRLRPSGPRDLNDMHYANARLAGQLRDAYERLGDRPVVISSRLECYIGARTLLFQVRTEWQVLFLPGSGAALARAELYGPMLSLILADDSLVGSLLGDVHLVLLNPTDVSFATFEAADVKAQTARNCELRGDHPTIVAKRVASVDEEGPAWRDLALRSPHSEYVGWAFPEYRYSDVPARGTLLRHHRSMLVEARAALLSQQPDLDRFLKDPLEIGTLAAPISA